MDFTNKVVIVTGGSSGIGAATAVLFAEYGAYLTLVGRNENRLKAVAKKCEATNGKPPLVLKLDLTDSGSCAIVVARTVATFGKIDVLINSAGLLKVNSLFDENIDVFEELIDLNLRVPFKLCHFALPYLLKTKGNIVNIVGPKYTRIRHGFIAYAITKSGMDTFTKTAAAELLSEGVRVNSVEVALSQTNVLASLCIEGVDSDTTYQWLANQHIKVVEPEEIGRIVVFVASGVCPNINGAELNVHGASTLI